MSEEKFLSTVEAAAHVGLHPVYFRVLYRAGTGPSAAIQRGRGRGGNRYRVEDLDAWLAMRRSANAGLLTTQEAAEYLGITVPTLKYRVGKGYLRCASPCPKGGAKSSARYDRADLDAYRASLEPAQRDLVPDVPGYLSPLQRAQKEAAPDGVSGAAEE